jgi:hypothetical protein
VRLRTEPKGLLALDCEVANRWWWYDGKSTNRLMMFVGQWIETRPGWAAFPAFGWILLPDILFKSRTIIAEYGSLPVVRRDEGLRRIRSTIEGADVLVGHNLTGFDIGTINGELKIANEPLLPDRPVIDTLTDKKSTIGQSMSLANRLSRLEGTVDKPHVDPVVWERAFNEFDPAALHEVWLRATTDVQGHIDLFLNDTERGYLR